MNKKIIAIILMLIGVLLIGVFAFIYIDKQENRDTQFTIEESIEDNNEDINVYKTIEFLDNVHGLKIENVELINNPVGFKGVFLVPKEAMKNGINYFLKESKNEKIDKVNINIGNGYIKAKMNYKINNRITTPIEAKVIPSLNENKDLLLRIDDVKFLDLNIAKWIVDIGVKNFLKDWFSKDSDILVKFDEGSIIIDKSNFKSITLENIKIDSKELRLDMMIDLEKLMTKEK